MSTTKTPAKRTTKRKALPHNLPAHNCILCRTRSPSIIGRVTPTDNLSSNFESGLQVQIIRQQQQQLIILRHASKCRHRGGKCPVRKQWGSMKNIRTHIIGRKSQKCSTPHCVSSRYLLSHYPNCKEMCPVCGPVKSVIQAQLRKRSRVAVVEETGWLQAKKIYMVCSGVFETTTKVETYKCRKAFVAKHSPICKKNKYLFSL